MQIRKQKNQQLSQYAQYVIIDTDIGGDDAQAIIYAISQAKKTQKKIIGITCVNGSAFLQDVVKNTVIVQSLCNSDIPIYLGSDTSLLGNLDKSYYFSKDGLGSKQAHYWDKLRQQKRLKTDLIKKDMNAAEFIIQSAKKYSGKLGIVAIGPLTNLSIAYHLDNTIIQDISIVSIMGGSITGIGIRQFFSSQFNFFIDANAANIVLDKFKNVVMVTFDFLLEQQKSLTRSLFNDRQTEKGRFINDVYQQIVKNQQPALYDPIAVALIFNPQVVKGYYEVSASVQITGRRTSGCIVFDWFQTTNNKRKVKLISKIDLERVVRYIRQSYH